MEVPRNNFMDSDKFQINKLDCTTFQSNLYISENASVFTVCVFTLNWIKSFIKTMTSCILKVFQSNLVPEKAWFQNIFRSWFMNISPIFWYIRFKSSNVVFRKFLMILIHEHFSNILIYQIQELNYCFQKILNVEKKLVLKSNFRWQNWRQVQYVKDFCVQ